MSDKVILNTRSEVSIGHNISPKMINPNADMSPNVILLHVVKNSKINHYCEPISDLVSGQWKRKIYLKLLKIVGMLISFIGIVLCYLKNYL